MSRLSKADTYQFYLLESLVLRQPSESTVVDQNRDLCIRHLNQIQPGRYLALMELCK